MENGTRRTGEVGMNYKSPIDLIVAQAETEIENEIVRTVQRMGINIDKDELMRALAYDRNQYVRGYYDRDSEIVRCKDCKHYMTIHCTCDGCCISDDWYCANGERRETND